MAWIATTFIIFQQTHSVLATSFPSISFYIPAILLGPISTRLSSRIGATQLFVVSEAAVALVTLLPVTIALFGHVGMTTLLIWEFAQGSAIGLQGPSKNIVTLIFAPHGKVPEYNSQILRAVAVSAVIGFLVGGILLDTFGPLSSFALDALSSLALAAVVMPRFRDQHRNEKRETITLAFPLLKKNPGLRSVFLLFGVVTVVGSIVVLFPSIADSVGKRASGLSFLNMAFVFGGLFVVGSVRFLHQRVKWGSVVWVNTIMTLLLLLLLLVAYYVSSSHSLTLALVLLILLPLGFLVSLQTSILTALVQIGSPKGSRSSVIELFTLLPMVIIPLSEAIIGFLADQFTVSFALASVGIALILVFALSMKSHQKQALAAIDQQQEVFEVHRTSPFRWEARSQECSSRVHNAEDFKTGEATDSDEE
jgi:MFS family permease